MQAWADNLLLTARKLGAPADRRRDGSQESCASAALHSLQQELGIARQAAQGGPPLPLCSCGLVWPLSSPSHRLTGSSSGRAAGGFLHPLCAPGTMAGIEKHSSAAFLFPRRHCIGFSRVNMKRH